MSSAFDTIFHSLPSLQKKRDDLLAKKKKMDDVNISALEQTRREIEAMLAGSRISIVKDSD